MNVTSRQNQSARRAGKRMQNRAENRSENRAMGIALAFGLAITSSTAALALQPREGAAVAVFTWPWAGDSAAMRVIAAADARIISTGGRGWVAIARDDQPGLQSRLYGAGAMFVADAAFVAACGGPSL